MEQLNIFDYLNGDNPEKPENLGGGERHFDRAHCLFEQSGTFKNEFIKLGIPAKDYDIQNEFGQTDCVIDLFAEIRNAYSNKPSIFDDFSSSDIILAFFPCTRFEAIIPLKFRGEAIDQKNWDQIKKLEYSMKLQNELTDLYILLSMMAEVVIKRNLKMIIENPYTQPHYLTTYWCLRPSVIDKDRTRNGDYYRKPTQYFFINLEPGANLIFDSIEEVETRTVMTAKKDTHSVKTMRSMIHPQYANRFIRRYIL